MMNKIIENKANLAGIETMQQWLTGEIQKARRLSLAILVALVLITSSLAIISFTKVTNIVNSIKQFENSKVFKDAVRKQALHDLKRKTK